MSHIVTIKTEVRDPAAIAAACRRLNYPEPAYGTKRLFTAEATGWAVQLPGWRHPILCDTVAGTIAMDTYNGAWGDRKQLDQFLQVYAVEKAKLEARRNGHTVSEQPLADGSIKLTVHVGGAA